MGKWVLDRFELLYFDLKHKRWRLFQEDPSYQLGTRKTTFLTDSTREEQDERVNYRRYIQHFLHSIRAAFDKAPKGSEITVGTRTPIKTTDITIDKESLIKLRDAFVKYKPGKEPDEVLRNILQYYQDVIRFEKLDGDIAKLFDEFLKKITNTGFAQDVTLKDVSYSTALDALSILPILRHWDILGALDQGWTGTQDSLLHEAGRIREPMYAANLIYRQKGSDPNALSTKLLGYEVRLRAVYQDIANPSAIPQVVAENDYFAYCHNPPLQGNHSEKPLYLTYGAFVDGLQKALTTENKNKKSDLLPIFYVAYPIVTTFGRRHFLHFYLRPDDGNETATLQDLWDTWKRFHALIGWENLRPLLVSEMEHIDLAYFQTFLAHEISETGQENLALKLCQKGHLMFPMAKMEHNGAVFQYEDYKVPYEINEEGECIYGEILFDCGEVWRQQKKPRNLPTSDKRTLPDLDIAYWPEKSGRDRAKVTEILNEGRRERTIRQQYDLAHQMWYAHQKQREVIEKMMANLRSDSRCRLERLPFSEKSALREKLLAADDWRNIIVVDNQKASDFLKPWLKSNERLDDKHLHILLTILSGGVHLFLSEYLELHPIKRLTHGQKKQVGYEEKLYNFWGDWENLDICKSRHDELTGELKIICGYNVYELETSFVYDNQVVTKTYSDFLTIFTERVAAFFNNPNGNHQVNAYLKNLRKDCLRQSLSLSLNSDTFEQQKFSGMTPYVYLPQAFLGKIGGFLDKHIPNSQTKKVAYFRLPIGIESDDSLKNPYGTFLFRNYALIAVGSIWNSPDREPSWPAELRGEIVPLLEDIGYLYFGHRNTKSDWEYSLATERGLLSAGKDAIWPNEDILNALQHADNEGSFINRRKYSLSKHIDEIAKYLQNLQQDGLIILTFDSWYLYD